jgi:hypothetical protein
MDQSADAEKTCLNARPGSFEVIEPSRAFLRPGTATGIDSLRRPMLNGRLHCDPLRNAIRTHARQRSDPERPEPTTRPACPAESPTLLSNAAQQSLNSEPGCIKVVDTFRAMPSMKPFSAS